MDNKKSHKADSPGNQHSLISAIRDKYDGTHTSSENSFCQIYVPKTGPGAQGSGDFIVPSRLALDNCNICEAGSSEDIESLCCKVHELDLAKNKLTDWLQVFKLLQFIPLLQLLNLSFNQLGNATFPVDCDVTYGHVTVLILNGTGISWDVVSRVLKCFPSLSELHLSLNHYENVELPADICHKTLVKLFVNGCKLHHWTDVGKLGTCFPCLELLNVIKSEIRSIEEEKIRDCFPALKALNISGNPLESWEEIDRFRLFPSLESLRIFDVPFLDELPEKERRQHLVSRLPNIIRINGSRVTETEKIDAERAFIRYFMKRDTKPPRFHELEAQHGKLAPLVEVDLSSKDVIQLKVKFEDKEEMMDVDVRQTVFEFKKLLWNFTGLPPTKFRIFHIENFEGMYKDSNEIKLPNKILRTLNFKEESEIQIDRK